ncbi:hypothetical protein OTU49_006881 [Cherax quadricarinatus]|uniref:poly(A)-specific ribonuclease n=1 Tax=Cherax quadricarinatus TaxID=27406 RepID=A0AAW0WKP1_CHEQU|nr:uncharacterized protein LOC128700739 isoform X1 [Cherax quadricarinatus]
MHDVDRYRGSCLIVSKPRGGRGHPRGRRPPQDTHHQQQQQQHLDNYMMEGGSALAGMPLFSFLPQRRGGGRSQQGRQQQQQQHYQQQRGHSSPPHHKKEQQCAPGGGGGEDGDELERLPLARLALHTQGAPLILSSRGPHRTPPPCSPNTASPPPDASPPPASDAVSVTSDEGSTGHAENCLPRIIKPRKRRKKDRKPTGGTGNSGGGECVAGGEGSGDDSSGTIVTLKPYMPMCYNYGASTHARSCEGSRACGCGQCAPIHVFPTPPPSPASSALSTMSSASSSCSSSSEDEPLGAAAGGDGDGESRSQLVRSLSEPKPQSTIHISSTVTQSFAGHRDLDIRIVRSVTREVPARTRHWSVPAVARHTHSPLPPLNIDRHFLNYCNTAVTTPHPPQRPWIHLGDADRTRPSCIFSVMCYNVLCDKYATRQMYGYCPSWALEWEYRKKGIMDEIKHYLADIITLQEVETDQFFNFFLPELKNEGYDGIFSPKSRAKHMSENERKYVDGCAIFWRTSKFSLVKERLIEFNQLAMANHDGSEDMLNRVMTKDNIGLAALLETKEAAWENTGVQPDKSQVNQAVLVCTAHIHWDPEFCDVKLIQTIMLMSEIRQVIGQIVEDSQHRSRLGRKMEPNSIQLLLCGDLNSLPDSGVVEFLTKGSVSMDHEDFKGFGYKTCLQKIAMTKSNNSLVNSSANIYTHSFRLAAAYDFSIMAYTNYTYDFKGIIDYIFHSADTMSSLGVLGPIDPDWFRANKIMGCPHPHIPSDHFSLLVQLEMRPVSMANNHPNGLLHR